MKQKKLIAEFQLNQQQFSLYLIEYEFILELKRHFRVTRTSPKQNAWLAFADQATYEDVHAGIDAFHVMRLTRQHLVNYLTRHSLPYFYFHAATARKAKIYPRFVRQLLLQLPNYQHCAEHNSFYFYQSETTQT